MCRRAAKQLLVWNQDFRSELKAMSGSDVDGIVPDNLESLVGQKCNFLQDRVVLPGSRASPTHWFKPATSHSVTGGIPMTPADLESFWSETRQELDRVPLNPSLEEIPELSGRDFTI